MEPSRYLSTPRGTFAVDELGPSEGPRVLCLHGFPDTPAGMRPLAEALAARGYRCVAPWLRGYWPSPPSGPFDLETLGADVLAIDAALDAAGPRATQKLLLGHDWGAVIGWSLLAHPHPFERAALLAVPHPLAFLRAVVRDPSQAARSRYMAFFQLGALADRAVARDDFAYVERLWRSWSPGFEPGTAYWAHLRETLRRSHPAPLAYYRAVAWPPGASIARVRDGGGRIATPILHLMGERDGCIAPSAARGQERYCDALDARVVPGVGHFLHFEAPERIAALVHGAFEAQR